MTGNKSFKIKKVPYNEPITKLKLSSSIYSKNGPVIIITPSNVTIKVEYLGIHKESVANL